MKLSETWLFREPKDDEKFADYVVPRAVVLFLFFVGAIMFLCVVSS